MAIENFGVGHVDPENGSNGNTGYAWTEAKQTIESAISAGFTQIEILAGAHTVSSITSPVELVLHAGTHLFSNAPVVSTVPIGLIGDAATVTAPSPVADLFQITNGNNNIDGGVVMGVEFDQTAVSRSAVYTSNVSNFVAERNTWIGSSDTSNSLFYATATAAAGMRSNWWRVDSNRSIGGPLIVVSNPNDQLFNGWVVRSNRCDGAETEPFVLVSGGQTRGWAVMGNSFHTVGSLDAAVYFQSPTNGLYWYGNRGRDIGTTNNLLLRADNIASSYIEHPLGGTAGDGNIELNGQLYSGTQPDTGVDGRGGRDVYDTGNDVRIVIIGRY